VTSSEDHLLAVSGPTASGKTTVAVGIAERLGGEIVACDSVQVYRGFEIGSAKPTAQEKSRAPHHVIDVVDWNEAFDAARYRELAARAARDIRERGKQPILCGGTGLYLRALRFGLVDAPPADQTLRRRLMDEEAGDPGSLYRRLAEVDPDTARRTEPANTVHIVRALEIWEQTGRKPSAVRAGHGFAREEVPMRVVALRWPAEVLRERIAQRSAQMVHGGLLDEVSRLLDAGVSLDCRPMQAVGYREAVAVVVGNAPEAGLADRIAKSTRALARRQRTWLRRERGVEWLDAEGGLDAVAERLVRQVTGH
jgi:tRNA dimethylallyltransferase